MPDPLAFGIANGVGVLAVILPSLVFHARERASARSGNPATYPKRLRRAIWLVGILFAVAAVVIVAVWGAYGPWHNGTAGSIVWLER